MTQNSNFDYLHQSEGPEYCPVVVQLTNVLILLLKFIFKVKGLTAKISQRTMSHNLTEVTTISTLAVCFSFQEKSTL